MALMTVMSMALLTAERCRESVATPSETVKDNEFICLVPPPRTFKHRLINAPKPPSLQAIGI